MHRSMNSVVYKNNAQSTWYLKKSVTNLKIYVDLFRKHIKCFELS
jgi:hypothetical protein